MRDENPTPGCKDGSMGLSSSPPSKGTAFGKVCNLSHVESLPKACDANPSFKTIQLYRSLAHFSPAILRNLYILHKKKTKPCYSCTQLLLWNAARATVVRASHVRPVVTAIFGLIRATATHAPLLPTLLALCPRGWDQA